MLSYFKKAVKTFLKFSCQKIADRGSEEKKEWNNQILSARDKNLSLHFGDLLENSELRVAADKTGGAHARDIVVSRERSLLDTAQALTLTLAQHSRGLHGILAAEQAQLAPVAVSSGTVDRVGGSAQLEAAFVFC